MDEQAIHRLLERAASVYQLSLDYLSSPETLFQLGIIALALVPAWFVSGYV